MSQPTYATISPSLRSGLTGGAATGHGVEYQTWYAVYVALKLMCNLLRDSPTQRPILVIEPRILTDGSLTRWDIRTTPDPVAIEAKSNLSQEDLVAFLQRCGENIVGSIRQDFELVYGACPAGLLQPVEKLIRLAVESAGNEVDFEKFCALECNKKFRSILTILGKTALPVAERLILNPMPELVLHDAIEVQLKFLFSPSHRVFVKNYLCSRFMAGMRRRETFFLPELVTELQENGIQLISPGMLDPIDIDPIVHKSVFVMQRCETAIPISVLANIVDCPQGALQLKLEQTQVAAIGLDDLCTCSPLHVKLQHPEVNVLLSNAIGALVEFVRSNKANHLGRGQVANVVALVEICKESCPAGIIGAFEPLDKLLKRGGHKRQVLKMASFTIVAAGAVSPPTEATRKAEAKALICGLAWVYQRIGRFEEAETVAKQSLELGESIGWVRNTAYCLKCIGRLRRVRAEHEHSAHRRSKLLSESRDYLGRAISSFSTCEELSPTQRTEEMADCYSLLGRTHLLTNRAQLANECAILARDLMTSVLGYEKSKDYMDLLILEAELLAQEFEYARADKKFAEALSLLDSKDAEKSEIAARAYLGKGKNRFKWTSDKKQSVEEVQHALLIWERLDEHFYCGLAEWTIIEINDELTKKDKSRLKPMSFPVRVEMVRLMRLNQREQNARTLSQRDDLNDLAWKNLHAEAKKNDAIRYRRW